MNLNGEYFGKSDLAIWVSTPAFIEMCAIYDVFDRNLLPKLEKIILAGEVLTKKLVLSLWKKFPGVKIINGYGPTEGTVLLTCCIINSEMVEDNKDFFDNSSGKGELIVSSKSISSGYYKNFEATKKSFFSDRKGNVFYRTGDIVYEIDGLIYYCGRKDFQIKLNGYRIELDDISENINKIEYISNNIVLPVYRDGRVSYIAAFVVLNKDLELSVAKTSIYIRKELSRWIPSYMIPKKIIVLKNFPLNVNGKIDRKFLRETYL